MTGSAIPPRDTAQRVKDVRARLERETDLWVASAGPDGLPYLVPLSFLWDGRDVWLVTRLTNPTGRNLAANPRTRLALGDTRDVVLLDGEVTTYTHDEVPAEAADGFHAKTGWNARRSGPAYRWFRVRPTDLQAWHEEPELAGRQVMTGGEWADA
ncbi:MULTISPECIES: pyridoxamine 5'-phosphate oxidase family protein [unclassified Streptomyces]|uniref:pyridoxamine 5'-phosphate oxidase family protein n=1 Tax=unclassified Streptomyces TaxID=2593676 RepID=UPI0004C5C50A|nr:pyridoxamine 5'-phosphate oxidase family protein [Streptomyces sp. NRRL F-5727]